MALVVFLILAFFAIGCVLGSRRSSRRAIAMVYYGGICAAFIVGALLFGQRNPIHPDWAPAYVVALGGGFIVGFAWERLVRRRRSKWGGGQGYVKRGDGADRPTVNAT